MVDVQLVRWLELKARGDERAARGWLETYYKNHKEEIARFSQDNRALVAGVFTRYGMQDLAERIMPSEIPEDPYDFTFALSDFQKGPFAQEVVNFVNQHGAQIPDSSGMTVRQLFDREREVGKYLCSVYRDRDDRYLNAHVLGANNVDQVSDQNIRKNTTYFSLPTDHLFVRIARWRGYEEELRFAGRSKLPVLSEWLEKRSTDESETSEWLKAYCTFYSEEIKSLSTDELKEMANVFKKHSCEQLFLATLVRSTLKKRSMLTDQQVLDTLAVNEYSWPTILRRRLTTKGSNDAFLAATLYLEAVGDFAGLRANVSYQRQDMVEPESLLMEMHLLGGDHGFRFPYFFERKAVGTGAQIITDDDYERELMENFYKIGLTPESITAVYKKLNDLRERLAAISETPQESKDKP